MHGGRSLVLRSDALESNDVSVRRALHDCEIAEVLVHSDENPALRDQSRGRLRAAVGIPDAAMGMIDVRDVARLHVKALTALGVAGKRFIAARAAAAEARIDAALAVDSDGLLP